LEGSAAEAFIHNEPANCGNALARTVARLLRESSPSSTIERSVNSGARADQATITATNTSAANTNTALATAFIRRMSAGSAVDSRLPVLRLRLAMVQPLPASLSSRAKPSNCTHSAS